MDAEIGIVGAVEAKERQSVLPTMAEVRASVCRFYSLSPRAINIPSREKPIITIRQMFCHLARRYCGASLKQIAINVGYRDHTTVWHCTRRIEELAKIDPVVASDLALIRDDIEEKLNARTGRIVRCG